VLPRFDALVASAAQDVKRYIEKISKGNQGKQRWLPFVCFPQTYDCLTYADFVCKFNLPDIVFRSQRF
jgi:hypothetical protein